MNPIQNQAAFFIVWNHEGLASNKRFANSLDAKTAAERLSHEHPTHTFYVMQSLSSSRTPTMASLPMMHAPLRPVYEVAGISA